jgi:hypothetical protein
VRPVSLSTIGEMTARAWRSTYESQEHVIITRTGTQTRKPVAGRFAAALKSGEVPGDVPGRLAAMI